MHHLHLPLVSNPAVERRNWGRADNALAESAYSTQRIEDLLRLGGLPSIYHKCTISKCQQSCLLNHYMQLQVGKIVINVVPAELCYKTILKECMLVIWEYSYN